MPTIGSVSGTFGHGRSPQNAPQPGFTIFPPIGRTSTWNFTANGAFEFEANTVSSMTLSSPQTGNCFVITPTTTFIANIAAWGAGGTSTKMSTVRSQTNIAGAGGAVQGTFMFQGGQPYTVFVSGTGVEYVSGGSGGGSSGIFEGNIFQLAAGPADGLSDVVTGFSIPTVNQYQVTFNGTNQYLTTPSTANYDLSTVDWTVECWVYVTANGNNTILTSGVVRSSAHNMWQINANGSLAWLTNPSGSWAWGNTYASGAGVVPNNTWTHIAAVRNGTNFNMYVDGVSVHSTNSFAGAGSSGTLFIGTYFNNVNNDGSMFRGVISNFRIVKGTAVYTSAFATPTASLTAIANTVLLICNSTTFVDLSPNAVTITPVNSPVISIGTLSLTSGLGSIIVNSVYVAMASGGGGGAQETFRLAGAGGDARAPQYGTVTASSQSLFNAPVLGRHGYLVSQPGQSGLPGRYSDWFTGGRQALGTLAGGGSMRGATESGGLGYVRTAVGNETGLEAVGGNYSIAALYDHSRRGTAGDSDHSGRMSIYLDQYQVANITATGGTVTDVPIPGHELAYRYHTFDTSSTFVVNSAAVSDTVDIFAVGGGGGGLEILPTGTVGAGGGGGGVALRIGYSITAGTYNVDVGAGGLKSDQYATTGTGRIRGGYKGGDSAFYINALASKAFPDSYWRLLNSFGVQFKYISLSGDDTDGSTQATAYTSFSSALAKNVSNADLVVFAVIGGTYTAEMPGGGLQSPIIDAGRPRIFVCAPGKVIINFTPANAQSIRSSPMASLSHSLSAVYGAVFVRTMFESTRLEETAFFNDDTDPTIYRCVGSFYNCVFRENSNFWSLGWGYRNKLLNCRIENCTFFTKNSPQAAATVLTPTLIKNSIFNKAVTTDAVLDNTATNQTVTTKYVATGITDKGVFSGAYSWDGKITVPSKTARTAMIMAQGGGGGTQWQSDLTTQTFFTPDQAGGNGGGVVGATRSFSTQYNRLLNPDYSSYGFPCIRGGGGGGAAYPGDSFSDSPRGGVGIEWPCGSGVYYGTGGDTAVESIVQVATGTVGKGGNGSGSDGSQAANGSGGMVAVRYVVPGPYTPPARTRTNVNLIAYGGVVTSTATYRQHVFTSSDRFVMLNCPEGITLEVLAVGGGGGAASRYFSFDRAYGGRGGNRVYNTISLQDSSNSLAVVVGAGGRDGSSSSNDNARFGAAGGDSTVTSWGNISISAAGGNGGHVFANFTVRPGTVNTQGLFSDNTQAYGADGGFTGRGYPYNDEQNIPNPANWGSYGSGGRAPGGSGLQGVVIIRYPIYPAN